MSEAPQFGNRSSDMALGARSANVVYRAVGNFLDFIDQRQIIRRFVLITALWMAVKSAEWTWDFGYYSSRPGLEVAAIIGAMWTPMAALLGMLVKFYDTHQTKEG